MDWTTIRDLCEANGLAKELRRFELNLPKALAQDLMTKTGKMDQYLSDNRFRGQVDLLCVIAIHVLTKAGVASMHLRSAFEDEVRKVME